MTTLQELKDYYSNLLIVQYHNKPKAKTTVELLIKILWGNGETSIGEQILNAFDVETAIGKQLDIIGIWEGIDRKIDRQLYDDHNWFSLIDEGGAISQYQGGFSEENTFDNNDGGILTDDLVANEFVDLSDDSFRFLIKLRIIKNHIEQTAKNIDDAIYQFSDGNIYTTWDLTNRVLIYYVPDNLTNLMTVAKQKNCLPCPMPVSIEIREI